MPDGGFCWLGCWRCVGVCVCARYVSIQPNKQNLIRLFYCLIPKQNVFPQRSPGPISALFISFASMDGAFFLGHFFVGVCVRRCRSQHCIEWATFACTEIYLLRTFFVGRVLVVRRNVCVCMAMAIVYFVYPVWFACSEQAHVCGCVGVYILCGCNWYHWIVSKYLCAEKWKTAFVYSRKRWRTRSLTLRLSCGRVLSFMFRHPFSVLRHFQLVLAFSQTFGIRDVYTESYVNCMFSKESVLHLWTKCKTLPADESCCCWAGMPSTSSTSECESEWGTRKQPGPTAKNPWKIHSINSWHIFSAAIYDFILIFKRNLSAHIPQPMLFHRTMTIFAMIFARIFCPLHRLRAAFVPRHRCNCNRWLFERFDLHEAHAHTHTLTHIRTQSLRQNKVETALQPPSTKQSGKRIYGKPKQLTLTSLLLAGIERWAWKKCPRLV